MPTLEGNNLSFHFPELGESAKLTISFRWAESPQGVAPIVRSATGEGFAFPTLGRLTLHFDSEFPFAVLATIGGRNVLTGNDHTSSLERPQNYFAIPPQQITDGYFDGQQFHPFYASCGDSDIRTPLVVKVFPMKAMELAWFKNESRKCGYSPRGWGTTFSLDSKGGSPREPVYEDTRSLGDWDQSSGEEAIIWLHQQ